LENVIELFPKSSEPIKSIMLNEINGAAGLASLQAPSLRLKLPLSSLWLAFWEEWRTSQAISLSLRKLRQDALGHH